MIVRSAIIAVGLGYCEPEDTAHHTVLRAAHTRVHRTTQRLLLSSMSSSNFGKRAPFDTFRSLVRSTIFSPDTLHPCWHILAANIPFLYYDEQGPIAQE